MNRTKNPNEAEIERLKREYMKPERINPLLPRVTNRGDAQWMILKRIRELGSNWRPSFRVMS